MTVIISGDNGVSDVDGSAGTPAIRGTDANTGIFFPAADTIAFAEGGAEAMRIDSSGNVGIGTNSPQSLLSVKVSAARQLDVVKDSGDDHLVLKSTAPDDSYNLRSIELAGVDVSFSTGASSGTTYTERARITSGGYFKASNNGTYLSSTSNTHEFNSDQVNAAALRVHASSATYNNNVLFASCARTTTNGSIYLITAANGNNTGEFNVWDSGDVKNTNNSYGAISDIKLKENIVDAGSQWDDFKALQVRKYNLKEGQTHTQIGLIAQEVELVSPGLVYESPDFQNVEVPVLDDEGNPVLDEEGNPQVTTERQATGTVTKGVKYSILYMKAVKALQEAMERIETLEAKVAALEANNV